MNDLNQTKNTCQSLLNIFKSELSNFTGELNSIIQIEFTPNAKQEIKKDSIEVDVLGKAVMTFNLNGKNFEIHNAANVTYELKNKELAVVDFEIPPSPTFLVLNGASVDLDEEAESLFYSQFSFIENPNLALMVRSSTPVELQNQIKHILLENSEEIHFILGIKLIEVFNGNNANNLQFKINTCPDDLKIAPHSTGANSNEHGLISSLSVIFDEKLGVSGIAEIKFNAIVGVSINPNNIKEVESITGIKPIVESFKVLYKGDQVKLFKNQNAVMDSVFDFNKYLDSFNKVIAEYNKSKENSW
ncbi:hypothetical protein A7M79_07250 [Acinetobacter baumannii]|uniref:hypothetical protein n=1 Tax=Acinetobacter baumannii TaxID=470 RepID=UPI0008DD623B|nr:hypothetical protein [Acinetobacter baumannii]OIH08603.1 hypothetical protein A7M79_07250 [Acinetobacter baumannii]